MKNQVQEYLLKLSQSGTEPVFGSVTCTYGKFTMYCLIGPEEKILQVTFAPLKHQRLQEQLHDLHRHVHIKTKSQKKIYLDPLFAEYFSGRRTSFPVALDSPLIAAGTDFQKKVWRHMAAIPYGSRMTYKELAEAAGSPKGARAVGGACGANPLSLLIPCHRVTAVNGLGGFAGGIAMKKSLLDLEHGVCANVE